MTLNRWKVLACTLTIGVGGLAVFATPPGGDKTEPTKEPAPLPNLTVKPTSPPNGSDTPAPDTPAKGAEFDIDIALPPLPAKGAETPAKPAESPTKPTDLPVFEPITPGPAPILPVKADDKKPEADKPPEVVLPPVTKPDAPPLVIPMPDTPKAPPAKAPTPDLDLPPVVTPTKPVAPPIAGTTDLLPPPVAPPTAPDAVKLPLLPAAPTKGSEVKAAKLKLLLRMGDGQPRFEIRNSTTTELLLKVYGERVEMQAPPDAKSSLAGVTATGRVRFTAPGIEGTCDHLTILSGTGEVLLKGNIHMKTKRGKAWSEMTAEKMVYQIGNTGLSGAPAPRNPVTPASYIPD